MNVNSENTVKTCSNKCKDKYHKICVDRNNDKNKSATIADKKAI